MTKYAIVGITSGRLLAMLDRLANGNPLARSLYAVYHPIGRTSVNSLAGLVIDLAYGLVMASVFLLLYPSLPGGGGLVKGIAFALLTGFFRVVMGTAAQWKMFDVPATTLVYALVSGLAEMLALGILYGLAPRPAA
jgi:O-antigen ligase